MGREVRLLPARRFGSGWTLRVRDGEEWREALLATHPELLR
jgi:hypothetical protein